MLSDNTYMFQIEVFFSIACAVPSWPSITRVTQCLFSWFARSFGRPLLCLSISPPTSFLRCATEDWLMPTKAAALRVETPFYKLHQSLVLMFLRQRRHTTTNDSTNCTSRNMEPMLHNAQEISRRSKLLVAHKDVDVGREVSKKTSIVTLTTSTFPILETLYSSHFLVSHVCNWLLGLLLWSFHHFVCNSKSTDNGSQSYGCVQHT